MLLSNWPFGSVTSVVRRTLVLVSSSSNSVLTVFKAVTSHSFPRDWNSLIRLKDATVERGTQWSGFAVCRVHMNLAWFQRLLHGETEPQYTLVVWKVWVCEVELDYKVGVLLVHSFKFNWWFTLASCSQHFHFLIVIHNNIGHSLGSYLWPNYRVFWHFEERKMKKFRAKSESAK